MDMTTKEILSHFDEALAEGRITQPQYEVTMMHWLFRSLSKDEIRKRYSVCYVEHTKDKPLVEYVSEILAINKREARKIIEDGAVEIWMEKVYDPSLMIDKTQFSSEGYCHLWLGKKGGRRILGLPLNVLV